MKKYFFAFFVLLFLFSCQSSKRNNDISWFLEENKIYLDYSSNSIYTYKKLKVEDADLEHCKSQYLDGYTTAQEKDELYKNLLPVQRKAEDDFAKQVASYFGEEEIDSSYVELRRIGLKEKSKSDGENYSLLELGIPTSKVFSSFPSLSKTKDEAYKLCTSYYDKAIEYYDNYEDTLSISLLLKAAVQAYQAGLIQSNCSFNNYLGLAKTMLSRLMIDYNLSSSQRQGQIKLRRNANIIKEGIAKAEILCELFDDNLDLIYSFSTISNDSGIVEIKDNSFILDSYRVKYSLALDDCDKELSFLRNNVLFYDNDLKSEFLEFLDSFNKITNFESKVLDKSFSIVSCIIDDYARRKIDLNKEDFSSLKLADDEKTFSCYNPNISPNLDAAISNIKTSRYNANNFVIILFTIQDDVALPENLYISQTEGSIYFYNRSEDKIIRSFTNLEAQALIESPELLLTKLKENILKLCSDYILYFYQEKNFRGNFL